MKNSKPKKEKADKNIYAYYIELESQLDFARQSFDYTSRHINAIKQKSGYRLVASGERLGGLRLVYYTQVGKIGNFFVYSPEAEPKEWCGIEDKLPPQADYKSYRAPIVEIASSPYIEAKDLKKGGHIIKIEAKDANSFIKALVSHSHDDEPPERLYAFFDGKDHIIGTFDFFHESSVKIFTYAKSGIKEIFSVLRYNYNNDTIEPASTFTEKTAVYIRVINLKKPFPFF